MRIFSSLLLQILVNSRLTATKNTFLAALCRVSVLPIYSNAQGQRSLKHSLKSNQNVSKACSAEALRHIDLGSQQQLNLWTDKNAPLTSTTWTLGYQPPSSFYLHVRINTLDDVSRALAGISEDVDNLTSTGSLFGFSGAVCICKGRRTGHSLPASLHHRQRVQ